MRKISEWSKIKNLAAGVMMAVAMGSVAVAGSGNLQKVFNDAKAAYDAGEFEKAASGFRKVLKYQPGYVYARKYLTQTEAKLKKGKTVVTLEGKLAKLQVPNVNFDNASLGTVLTYLSQRSEEISGGKVIANFIYKGPREDKDSKMVTLKLGSVPMTEVIRYVGQLTGTKFKYEEYAVVGVPTVDVARAEAKLEQRTAATDKPKFDDKAKDPFAK